MAIASLSDIAPSLAVPPVMPAPPPTVTATVLKEGGVFLVADARGDIVGQPRGLGLYEHDTRYLSHFALTVSGSRPVVSASTRPGPAVVSARAVATRMALQIHRTTVVDDGLLVTCVFRNPSACAVRATVGLALAADFRDLFEVRGLYRGPRGTLHMPETGECAVRFQYGMRDGQPLWTEVRASRPPIATTPIRTGRGGQTPGVRWRFALTIPAGGSDELSFVVVPGDGARAATRERSVGASLRAARSLARQWTDEVADITTDHAGLNRVLRRAAQDLRVLLTPCGAGEVPAAGIPWFVAPFGRDSCITALETLLLTPRFAVGTLRALAAYQGAAVVPAREEEPGKILHEIRTGELARLGLVPHAMYYGSIDSTPLFVMLFARTMRWLDMDALYADLLPHVRRALQWCDTWGDPDGDGYVEFGRHAKHGILNQGWKDSHDSLHHPGGDEVLRPVALAEVQAYVYAAKVWLADILAERGAIEWAAQLRIEAADLAARFERDFWMPDEQCYAYALDRDKRPVRTVVSNVGHLLYCGLPRPDRAALLAERLLRDDMCSGWGVRTLSAAATRFDPDSYHNGSIWPHDNALIARGMGAMGRREAATTVAAQVLEAGMNQPLSRLPELYAGYARDATAVAPTPYPVSCVPQAWSAASAFAFVQTFLGLSVDGRSGHVVCDPHLPPWLNRIDVRGLRIGAGRVTIHVARDGADGYIVDVSPLSR